MPKHTLIALTILCATTGLSSAVDAPKPAASPVVEEKPRLGDVPGVTPSPTQVKPLAPPPKPEKPRLGDIPSEPIKEKKEKKPPLSRDGITPEERKQLLEEVAQEFYEKGEMAYQEGRFVEARDLFERVLTLQPNHAQARARLEALLRTLEPPEPEPAPAEPDSKQVLIGRLSTELDQAIKNKDWDKAERQAKNILAVDPANEKTKSKLKIVHHNLSLRAADRAQTREKAGDFQGAVDAYRVAFNYSRDPAYTEKIESLMEKIREVNDRKSEEFYRQALDASQNGNNDKAIDLCKEALQLNPDNIQAQRMLDRLQSRIPS